jgi:RHS repeat-associated protein
MTNTWDAANRLVAATRGAYALEPIYNGAGDRVAQTAGLTTTYFALDVQGLPEVIYTSGGEAYLHLPGVIAAVSAAGERRYLLSDGLGSIRQATDESGNVVAYHEFDPYGVPVQGGGEPYGYTAEWWEDEVDLLHLRARHYDPETGRFLSKDPWTGNVHIPQTKNGYVYVLNNPVTGQDPSGMICIFGYGNCDEEEDIGAAIATLPYRVFPQDFCLGELGCWGGQAYADFLQNEYYPYIPDYIDNDIEAIRDYWTSHVLSEAIDGYVIGWLETVATIPARSQPVSDPWDPNQCPGFGTTGYGREIVYDFVHQERGAFKYSAVGETFGIVGSGSFGGYRGFTDGFRNGVEDYAGQFASVGLSVDTPLQVPILRLSGTWTWANPYERGSYNPAGVHAVYFGGSLNAGLGLPISGNVLYSFYELDKSVPTPIKDYNGDDNDDKENSLVNRTLAAVHMQTDMTRDSGYDTDSHSGVLTDLALSFMWMWVGYSGD